MPNSIVMPHDNTQTLSKIGISTVDTRFVPLLWAYMASLDWHTREKYIHRSTEPVILDLWLACEPCQTIIIKCSRNVAYLLRAGDNSASAVKHRPRKQSALLNGAWTPWYTTSSIWMEPTPNHYDDVIMGTMASQITSLTIVNATVYSGAHQRKHQSSASLVFVRGIHRGPVNSPYKWPVTRKMFPFDDVIIPQERCTRLALYCVLLWFGTFKFIWAPSQ